MAVSEYQMNDVLAGALVIGLIGGFFGREIRWRLVQWRLDWRAWRAGREVKRTWKRVVRARIAHEMLVQEQMARRGLTNGGVGGVERTN